MRLHSRGMSQSRVIRIVLVDDHEILRAGLKALVRDACDIVVVGEANGLAAGGFYLRPRVARMLAAAVRPIEEPTPADAMRARLSVLSERERDVVALEGRLLTDARDFSLSWPHGPFGA